MFRFPVKKVKNNKKAKKKFQFKVTTDGRKIQKNTNLDCKLTKTKYFAYFETRLA